MLAYDVVGPRMAGPGIRSWEIARALTADARVVLASTEPVERADPKVEERLVAGTHELRELAAAADAVLVHGFALVRHPELRLLETPLVVDLYDPFVFATSRARGRRAASRPPARSRTTSPCRTSSSTRATSSSAPRSGSATTGSGGSRRGGASMPPRTRPTQRSGA